MGQKISPKSLRQVLYKKWDSRWFSKKKYQDFLLEDFKIRKLIREKLPLGTVGRIEIERSAGEINVNIFTAKPGIVIGRSGKGTQALKETLVKQIPGKINLNILEIEKPALSAQILAENIAYQIQKRVAYKRAIKQAIQQAVEAGARGIKVAVSGRLGGADIARRETYGTGPMPLQTLRAQIDYAHVDAFTTYGVIGIKVWIYLGEVFEEKEKTTE